MIYLDSSALMKLVRIEPESRTLRDWLLDSEDDWTSSTLARVELVRSCRRVTPAALPAARSLLAGMSLIPLSARVLAAAEEIGDPVLRSLDALHLASAAELGGELNALVTYDQRLASAATTAGLTVSSPGATGTR